MRRIAVLLFLAFVDFAFLTFACAETGEPGWLGVNVQTITPALKAEKKLSFPLGVLVTAIDPESPAADALKSGDHHAYR